MATKMDERLVTVLSTEDLTAEQRFSIVEVCIAAHDNPAFANLFNDITWRGRHFLAYRGPELVSHAVVTTRCLSMPSPRSRRTRAWDTRARPCVGWLRRSMTT